MTVTVELGDVGDKYPNTVKLLKTVASWWETVYGQEVPRILLQTKPIEQRGHTVVTGAHYHQGTHDLIALQVDGDMSVEGVVMVFFHECQHYLLRNHHGRGLKNERRTTQRSIKDYIHFCSTHREIALNEVYERNAYDKKERPLSERAIALLLKGDTLNRRMREDLEKGLIGLKEEQKPVVTPIRLYG
jgi:hypothetical protein